ncbi:MAG TPA: hypothetical protein VMD52_03535 [Patescibacteria group bacterium]|nr:hypothetical protein [Patescibacteria group bacterium]
MQNDPGSIVIRKYAPQDRQAVRRICCETALMGEPSDAFFDGDEVFADALTAYFTDYEPQSCFVAERAHDVVGYLLGAKDSGRMDSISASRITLPLCMKSLRQGTLFRRKNAAFLFHVFLSFLKGEFRAPVFSRDYPAVLHINIRKGCRAEGTGTKLISAYLDYLKKQAVKGVHLATMSDAAGLFFRKQNFQLLFQGRRSYFRYFLGKDIPFYIYGMRF